MLVIHVWPSSVGLNVIQWDGLGELQKNILAAHSTKLLGP